MECKQLDVHMQEKYNSCSKNDTDLYSKVTKGVSSMQVYSAPYKNIVPQTHLSMQIILNRRLLANDFLQAGSKCCFEVYC